MNGLGWVQIRLQPTARMKHSSIHEPYLNLIIGYMQALNN